MLNTHSILSKADDMIMCPSVGLSHHTTAAPTCGGFAAEHRAYTTSSAAALATARHSAANASSVTFTADVRIRNRKLKSDLFLQAIITAFLRGRGLVSL